MPNQLIEPVSDPDAGVLRNAGLAFGHDMRFFFRQRISARRFNTRRSKLKHTNPTGAAGGLL
jgi:hypothetical protein